MKAVRAKEIATNILERSHMQRVMIDIAAAAEGGQFSIYFPYGNYFLNSNEASKLKKGLIKLGYSVSKHMYIPRGDNNSYQLEISWYGAS